MKDASFGIVLKENQVVLTQRLDVPIWVLPGGGIEQGESAEKACTREIYEETGLEVTVLRKSHEMTPINSLGAPTHVFLCETENSPTAFSNESRENRFFALNDLPKDLFEPHRIWIEEATSHQELIKRPLYEVTWMKVFSYFIWRPSFVLRVLWTRLTRH